MMDSFRTALGFLTTLPAGDLPTFDPKRAVPYFPLVGLVIGVLTAAADIVLCAFWPQPVAAAADLVLMILMTGALHLDGVADTADGMFSHRPRERALEIMKDSRVGAMGLIAVVCVLLLKWSGLGHLEAPRAAAIIMAPAYGRSAILIAMRFLPYGRPEGGTGATFFGEKMPVTAFWGLLIPVWLSTFLGVRCVVVNLVFAGVVCGVLYKYRKWMGGVTGDMLGALCEVTEAAVFFAAAAGGI